MPRRRVTLRASRLRRYLARAAITLAVALEAAEVLVGQVPDTALAGHGIIVGRVVDSARAPLSGVEIVVTRERDSVIVAADTSDGKGITQLTRLPTGGPYAVLARKIGFEPGRVTGIHLRGGDSLDVAFALRPRVVTLPEVTTVVDSSRRFIVSRKWLGLRLFKCLFLGIAYDDQNPDNRHPEEELYRNYGCTRNRDAHDARRLAKERAREDRRRAKEAEREAARQAERLEREEIASIAGAVHEAARRVGHAVHARRLPDPHDALAVRDAEQVCNRDVPGDAVLCRAILKRTSRQTLERLARALEAADSAAAGPTPRPAPRN